MGAQCFADPAAKGCCSFVCLQLDGADVFHNVLPRQHVHVGASLCLQHVGACSDGTRQGLECSHLNAHGGNAHH